MLSTCFYEYLYSTQRRYCFSFIWQLLLWIKASAKFPKCKCKCNYIAVIVDNGDFIMSFGFKGFLGCCISDLSDERKQKKTQKVFGITWPTEEGEEEEREDTARCFSVNLRQSDTLDCESNTSHLGHGIFSGVGLLGRFAVKTDMKSGTKEAADTKGTRAWVP